MAPRAPKSAQDAFRTAPGRPQELSRCAQDSPKSSQDVSKTPPRASKSFQESQRTSKTPLRWPQEQPKHAQQSPKSFPEVSRKSPKRCPATFQNTKISTYATPTHNRELKVCGGTREASYNPPHTFRCAWACEIKFQTLGPDHGS